MKSSIFQRTSATAVAFLASDDASYITGFELAFDGGRMSWTRLSEQFFRFDMWSSAGVRLPSGEAAA
jgi:hypothetical protein